MNYYHVSYSGGSSGKLISTLLMFLIEDINRPINFSGTNCVYSCHYEFDNYIRSTNFNDVCNPRTKILENSPWNCLQLIDNCYQNIYWPGGIIENYDTIIEQHPNFKNIVITINPEESLFVEINHSVKAVSSSLFNLEKFKWMFPDFKNSLKMLTTSQLDSIREDYSGELKNLDHDSFMKFYNNLNKDIQDCVYLISFFDIVNNPAKILDILSKVSGKPISSVVEEGYTRYINNQLNFYKTYVPFYPFSTIVNEPVLQVSQQG